MWQETQEVREGASPPSLPISASLTHKPHSPRRQHTCTLLDTSAFLEDYPPLDFVSRSNDLGYDYDTENAEVRPTRLPNDTGKKLIASIWQQHVDISSPPTFTAKGFQGIGVFPPSFNFDGFYRTQFKSSSPGSLDHDDDGSSSCTPPITDDLSSGDCDSDSCGTWEDHGGLDEYTDFYDDHRCVGSDRTNSLPRFSLTPSGFRYDDGTKDESALPFHIHLSLALKQLIGTPADDGDDWDEEDSDYLGPTPKWFYSFYDDGARFLS